MISDGPDDDHDRDGPDDDRAHDRDGPACKRSKLEVKSAGQRTEG